MIFNILTEPNEILHQTARALTKNEILSPDTQQLIYNLVLTMHAKDGVGLAAPQIGQQLQICVISKNYTADKKNDLILINPLWQKSSFKKEWDEEGCLSVPSVYGQVKRYKKIHLEAFDQSGEKFCLDTEGLLARIIQHETDHLHGILFIQKARCLRIIE